MHYATVRSRRVNLKTWCCRSSHHCCQVEPFFLHPKPPQGKKNPEFRPRFSWKIKVFQVKMKVGFSISELWYQSVQCKPNLCNSSCASCSKKNPPQFPSLGSCCFFFFFFESLEIPLAVLQKTTKKIYLDKGKQQKKKTKRNFPAVREFLIFLSIFSIFHQGSGPWDEGQG